MVTGHYLLVIFAIAIVFVLVSIIRFRLNPFLALLLASLLTGFLVRMPVAKISEAVATGFGNTLRGIGIVIGLGIILGELLARSGATEQIARTLIAKFGERHAPLVLTIVGYLVSTSVFMDAAFVILIPIVIRISTLTKTLLGRPRNAARHWFDYHAQHDDPNAGTGGRGREHEHTHRRVDVLRLGGFGARGAYGRLAVWHVSGQAHSLHRAGTTGT